VKHRSAPWLGAAVVPSFFVTMSCGGNSALIADLGPSDAGADATTLSSDAADDVSRSSDSSTPRDTGGPVDDGAPPPDAGTPLPPVCIPGQSVACTGPGGCVTNQVCNDAGTGFGPCVCASVDGGERACVPGASIGCIGPSGCVSNQVCKSDGSGYSPCDCANDGGSTLACVPGQSIACGGPGGCFSFQVCKGDGSGYAPCECPDAGGASDAGVEWSPAQLPGLALWFDSDGLVQDPTHPGFVQHWLDKSGNGNLGTTNNLVGPGSVFTGDHIDAKVANGYDAMTCAGPYNVDDYLFSVRASPTLDFGSGDFAIVAVVLLASGDLWNGDGVRLGFANGNTSLAVGAWSVAVPTALTGGFGIVVARGQSLSLQSVGATATGGTNTTPLVASPTTICNAGQELAELIVVKGGLSDADRDRVTRHLRTKFAL
jgi:hypothetical protein